ARGVVPGAEAGGDREGCGASGGGGGADPADRADTGVVGGAGRGRGGVRVRALPHRQEHRASRGGRGERLPKGRPEELPRLARRPPRSEERAPLRPRRGAPPFTRGGQRRLQRDTRAGPSDRGPVAEEA